MEWIRHLLRNIRIGSTRADDRKDFRAVQDELWSLVDAFKARAEEMERIAHCYRKALEKCQRNNAQLHLRLQQGGHS